MLSREEYISLVKEKQKEEMANINTERQGIIDLYVEYEGFLFKILESNLSLGELRECVMLLPRIYDIRFGDVIYTKAEAESDEVPKIGTMDDLKTELQSMIGKIDDALNSFELSQFVSHTQIIALTGLDFKERVRAALERNDDVKSEQELSEEYNKKQQILLLESVIGKQPEFKKIMGEFK